MKSGLLCLGCGLSLAISGCGEGEGGPAPQGVDPDRGITYEEVMARLQVYPPDGGKPYPAAVDPHALRKALGLDPVDPQQAGRRSLFRRPPGQKESLDIHESHRGEYRAVALSRQLGTTWVLLFRHRGRTHRFTTAFPGGEGDYGRVAFLEPDRGILLLQVDCRTGSGTGCCYTGRSLFLVQGDKVRHLLTRARVGYIVFSSSQQGHHIRGRDLLKTWPRLHYTGLVERYRDIPPDRPGKKASRSRRTAIAADLTLTWDPDRRTLRYDRENNLPEKAGRRFLADPDRFLDEQIAAKASIVDRSIVAIPYPFAYGK